ncbi:MAG: DUF2058 family protein [Xanthomonadales bacterium]|nr:DUF2058 family protein [Xanthomonadales bacterium]
MTQSLRDQLLGLGFKPAPKPEVRREAPSPAKRGAKPASRGEGGSGERPGRGDRSGKPGPGGREGGRGQPNSARHAKPGGGAGKRGEIDLAKAYAIRAQKEKEERIAAEAAKQEAARLKREARAKLHALLEGKALNREDADIARHFEYGGKIKRIYVTEEQLKQLNAGQLGVVQDNGRYLLVDAEMLAQAEAVFAAGVALKIDPNAPPSDDPYADPQYQVPDDLVW